MAEHTLGTLPRPLRVAIVGSGPSAFYAAEALFRTDNLAVEVDVFDRLPTPFGLVRGGVAPDHQKIKSVIRQYTKIAAHDGFRFFGNVMLGPDLQVGDLQAHYDHIVYAVGNESDRTMGIPGEDLVGVHSATSFVGWYNGHPDYAKLQFDLQNAERVVVVGNGNVAMDVTRVLVKSPAALAETDIADHALATLRASRVREVFLLGRRGPAQAAFSPNEIKEIGELDGVELRVDPADMALDEISARWLEESAPRSARRSVGYLSEQSQRTAGAGVADRVVHCRFKVSPFEIAGESGRVERVRVQHNELYAADDGTPRPRPISRFETIEAELVFKAIGYRGVPIAGVPFDDRRGIIPNAEGRVLEAAGGEVVGGQYVVGWAKRGPTGLIGTNMMDARATVSNMLADAADARLAPLGSGHRDAVPALLAERGIDFVTYEDWQRLDEHECAEGVRQGKVRVKLTSVDAMMQVIRRLRG